ncbi:MAG: RNA polymerase sigma factor SigW [Parcubacteria group bacterium GW2011_GWE2_39_37]|uniref:RNA polymerase sigma factor n=1 Tax=Candidatus Falkowbacteria bacterium GW2011_GWF2_39_8 TaxID=1618642 RepID=A0A0G0Q0D6_9BACT|nr:MAG: RNA polymerase sigma factor SigW [Parcubacteria group bacterium GW2011_GWE2_39_37]KKR33814.1 MAG: RNA polymerase sigma factor SigW [Candidatus Falkowbacteria bacterium GW2011_GWF2_39_8]
MGYQDLKDEELAKEIKAKNNQALAEIIGRYQNKLFYYVVRLIGNEEDAEDVVQETFLKVYENIQGFDENRKFSSWIYRIAHNLGINQIKKSQRLSAVEAHTLDWLEDRQEEAEDVIAQAERGQLMQEMKEKIFALREDYRDILILYYFEEKSYEEISDILHIPESTAGVWLRRARTNLKKIMLKQE